MTTRTRFTATFTVVSEKNIAPNRLRLLVAASLRDSVVAMYDDFTTHWSNWPLIKSVRVTTGTPPTKQTSQRISRLASKGLQGKKLTADEIRAVCASALGQDEKAGK